MRTCNVFLVITKAALDVLRPLMDDSEYNGSHIKAVRIFRRMADYRITENMWLSPVLGGKKRYLFSINLPGSSAAKDAIDYLIETYPTQIAVAGAWRHDTGLQVGLEYTDEIASQTGGDEYEYEVPLLDDDGVQMTVPQLDEFGNPVLDEFGERIQIPVTVGEIGYTPIVTTYVVEGTPVYPQHPQLIKFMPLVDGLAATELTDVNLKVGQSPRAWA
jgi:hypothetical protein